MNPSLEYARRLNGKRAEAEREQRRYRLVGNLRLGVALIAVALAFLVFGSAQLSPWYLAPPALIFVALVILHAIVSTRLERARRAVAYFEKGLARVEDRWIGTGERGERFRDPKHVYAEDLDLFGEGSLFELLCTARTQAGEEMLAGWLLAPATLDQARARQHAAEELRSAVDLREELAAIGGRIRSSAHPDAIARWGAGSAVSFPPATRLVALLLTIGIVGAFLAYMLGMLGRAPVLGFMLIEMLFFFALRSRVEAVLESAEASTHDLGLLADLLQRIELSDWNAPLLLDLRVQLETAGLPASEQIARLEWLIEKLEWGHNQFLAPLAAVLLWSIHFAVILEGWRKQSGGSIGRWIAVAAEFEALCSLACYAYEHPADPFPELVEEPARFDAEALGHPLLPIAQCVTNDVALSSERRLLIVSGSNMSGKSTLLRATGLNTVLAWAGAPVRARRLRISPLAVGASIRLQDSLLDGRSRFYAEITRLRQIVELASSRPTLFLIDELLSGTNSHDRRIGAEAIVRTLIERGSIGMITTHDLALAHIADHLDGRAVNVHFADTIEDGALRFDYRLAPGVVERSNALELMRSVGLEV